MFSSSSLQSQIGTALSLAFAFAGISRAAEPLLSAMVPVEVLAIDPALATGGISQGGARWDDPRIAVQPARVARAIVKETRSGKGDVLFLALLGELEKNADGTLKLDVAPGKQAWCGFPGFTSTTVNCFQDTDGDGKLETQRRGLMGADEAVALTRVEEGKPITPVAYRTATDAERPALQVGYKSCPPPRDTDATLDSELRFATLVQRTGGMRLPPPSVCNDIAKPLEIISEHEKLFQFGRFKVAIRADDDGELTTRLVEGITPGTLLGNLRSGRPLLDATDTPADSAAITGDVPFLRVVSLPKITEVIKPGEEFFSVEVQHGLTGKLTTDSTQHKWNGVTIPAGTPVYGIAMTSDMTARSYEPVIVWCAPRKNAQQILVAQCFAPAAVGFELWEGEWSPYTVQGVSTNAFGPIAAPVVERGPADFGAPLMIKLRYDQPAPKSSKKYLYVSQSVAPAGAPLWKSFRLRRMNDGAGHVWLGKAILKITPSADATSATVSVVGELAAGAEIDVPQDAVELLRR